MANDNRIDQIQPLPGFPPLVKNVPANYPQEPAPDKISLLWKYNSENIYHKYSPYTEGEVPFGILPNKQPFIWRWIGEKNKNLLFELPTKYKSFEGQALPISAVQTDVVRVAKWSLSGLGTTFYVKQAALQLLQPFDETRIYNPLSPILATVNPLAFGLIEMPTRHIELSISGLAQSVGLGKITAALGFDKYTAPPSSVGKDALSTEAQGQGKGLLRGPDSGKALSNLQAKWPADTGVGKLSISNMMKNAAKSLFSSVLNQLPTNASYRNDEQAYELMIRAGRFDPIPMAWYSTPDSGAGSSKGFTLARAAQGIINAASNVLTGNIAGAVGSIVGATGASRLLNAFNPLKSGMPARYKSIIKVAPVSHGTRVLHHQLTPMSSGLAGKSIGGYLTGYKIENNAQRYGNNVYPNYDSPTENSEMLVQYAEYIDEANNFESKLNDPQSIAVSDINKNLSEVMNKINLGGSVGMDVFVDCNSYQRLISSGRNTNPSGIGYGLIKNNVIPTNGRKRSQTGYGAEADYVSSMTEIKVVDASSLNHERTVRMATSFKSDALNRIGVLGKDKSFAKNPIEQYPGYTVWDPYNDDLIAFFFYDVVNEKYIPFRATVKGIAENNTAIWDDLTFIGRADHLYNYSGFTRTLNFTFNVVISSVMELFPTWKKINYIASAVKPANYTTAGDITQKNFNRFMIPPMFMITIGDMYKFQPIVITSVNVNIPDDASWETLNEKNSTNGWSYLNGMIYANQNLRMMYGQLPKEAEIQITCNLLEKERAIVGAAHYGHAPHTDLYLEDEFNQAGGSVEFLPSPTDLHKGFIEYLGNDTQQSYQSQVDSRQASADQNKAYQDELAQKTAKPPTSTPTDTGVKLNANQRQFATQYFANNPQKAKAALNR